jgi:hypothetical protein
MKRSIIITVLSLLWANIALGNSQILQAQLNDLNIDSAHYFSEYDVDSANILVNKKQKFIELTLNVLNSKANEFLRLPITSIETDPCNIVTYIADSKFETERITVQDSSKSICGILKINPAPATTIVTFSTFIFGKSFPLTKIEETISYLNGSSLFPVFNKDLIDNAQEIDFIQSNSRDWL